MTLTTSQTAAPSRRGRWLRRLAWTAGILVLLDGIATIKIRDYIQKSGGPEVFGTRTRLKLFEGLLAAHKFLHGHYPSEEEGLEVLFTKEGREQNPQKAAARLKDEWQRPIHYRMPGVHHPESYDLFSNGPDGIEGTEDDISNW